MPEYKSVGGNWQPISKQAEAQKLEDAPKVESTQKIEIAVELPEVQKIKTTKKSTKKKGK